MVRSNVSNPPSKPTIVDLSDPEARPHHPADYCHDSRLGMSYLYYR